MTRKRNRLASLVWDLAREFRQFRSDAQGEFETLRDLTREFRQFRADEQGEFENLRNGLYKVDSKVEQLGSEFRQFRAATQSELSQLRTDMRSEFDLVHARI